MILVKGKKVSTKSYEKKLIQMTKDKACKLIQESDEFILAVRVNNKNASTNVISASAFTAMNCLQSLSESVHKVISQYGKVKNGL